MYLVPSILGKMACTQEVTNNYRLIHEQLQNFWALQKWTKLEICSSVAFPTAPPKYSRREREQGEQRKGSPFSAKCRKTSIALSLTLTQGYSELTNVSSYKSNRHSLGWGDFSPTVHLPQPIGPFPKWRQKQLRAALSCLDLPLFSDSLRARPKHFLLETAFIKTLAYFNENLFKLSSAGLGVLEFVTTCLLTLLQFYNSPIHIKFFFFFFTWAFKNDTGNIAMGSYKLQLVK